MARAFCVIAAALLMAGVVQAGLQPPVTLPAYSAPNTTAFLDGAKAQLRATAQSVVMNSVTVKPFKCPNGKPLVTCLFDVCKGKCPGATEVCVPDFCGTCGHKCVHLSVPILDIKTPSIPKLPNITLPKKSPCGLNEAFNVSAIAQSLKSKNPKLACKACPEGTVASFGALACTLCPPGTYADRETASCRKCAAGSHALGFGLKECKACDVGSFAPISGSFACMKCPLGFAAPKAGSSKCEFVGFSS